MWIENDRICNFVVYYQMIYIMAIQRKVIFNFELLIYILRIHSNGFIIVALVLMPIEQNNLPSFIAYTNRQSIICHSFIEMSLKCGLSLF